jgi:hypothetical protein
MRQSLQDNLEIMRPEHSGGRRALMNKKGLKVHKCEIFDLLDLNDFNVIKSLKVRGL